MSVQDDLNNLGRKIVDDAKRAVPVDTGALKRSLDYKIDFKSLNNFNITFTSLEYGKYVNFGTSRQRAQPFMTEAINKNLADGISNITKDLTKEMVSQIKIKLQ